MDDFTDLLDALPVEQYYGTEAAPAKPDATIGILSLPTELLQQIADNCSNRTILSLMRVNSVLYGVSLRRFYANVHIACSKFELRLATIDSDLSIDEILPRLYHKKFGILGGLLRRPDHLANLKLLHLVDYPTAFASGRIIYPKVLRYILEMATSIHSIELPSSRYAWAPDFEGLVLSSSLKSVTAQSIGNNILTPVLKATSLHSLRITFECATFENLHELLDHMAPTLKDLQCFLHVPEGEWEASKNKIDGFISQFVSLECLKIGYCTCARAAKPQPEVTIPCFIHFVRDLPELKSVVISDRRNLPGQANVQKDEYRLVNALSRANPFLQTIGIEYLWHAREDVDPGKLPTPADKLVTWSPSRSRKHLNGQAEDESLMWTPSPRFRSRWGYWFDKFENPESVRQAMTQRWASVEKIPFLWNLTWYNEHDRKRATNES